MVVVAIAGGTGGVGRTVLDAIAKSGEHNAIVLSRTTANATGTYPFRRFALDYENVDKIKHVLQDNMVEVVVSCLVLVDEASAQSQINLIRAAAQSGTVTKFIPTEYYIDFHAPIPGSDLFTNFQLEAEEELSRQPQLTWTLIRAGIFLDHLTMPYNPKKTYMAPFWIFVDIDHEQCVFPGDGSYPLILTHSMDVAAYIERLVGLPANEWPRESLIASNKLQVKDLDSIIRKVTGKGFQVTYDLEEAVREGRITSLPSNQAVLSDPVNGDFLRQVEHQIMLSMLSKAHVLPGTNLADLSLKFNQLMSKPTLEQAGNSSKALHQSDLYQWHKECLNWDPNYALCTTTLKPSFISWHRMRWGFARWRRDKVGVWVQCPYICLSLHSSFMYRLSFASCCAESQDLL